MLEKFGNLSSFLIDARKKEKHLYFAQVISNTYTMPLQNIINEHIRSQRINIFLI
jgi:translation initiation factor 2 alpha subunit (eIF-2alpha)